VPGQVSPARTVVVVLLEGDAGLLAGTSHEVWASRASEGTRFSARILPVSFGIVHGQTG
jgi:hypothetical protein